MKVNEPADTVVRVDHDRLHAFVREAAKAIGMPESRGELLADLLTETDLRGVLSHGTWQLARYVRETQAGRINPTPTISTAHETANSLLLDGDGGLGYFPAHEGTHALITKAREHGMAMLVTRNHGHIGAAGTYPRLAAEHALAGFATSGVQPRLSPGDPHHRAAPSPPMAFSLPAGDEPPLVFDAAVTSPMRRLRRHEDPKLRQQATRVALRMIGLGTVCQAWGGLVAGLPADPERARRRYADAHQGAMVFVFDPGLFIERDRLGREMDELAQRIRQLEPLEGTEGAFLPGHVELERRRICLEEGIPLSEPHHEQLAKLAAELGLTPPWT